MSSIRNAFEHLKSGWGSSKLSSPDPGLHHYLRQEGGERSRIHLRIDPDGSGLLIVNANRVMHLNPSATTMAYLALENSPLQLALRTLTTTYRVPKNQALNDYTNFTNQLDELIRPEGACPIHELEVETTIPFSARPSAPYRMDLALTYRCNNECAHCYNARPRSYPELSTEALERMMVALGALQSNPQKQLADHRGCFVRTAAIAIQRRRTVMPCASLGCD